MSKDVFIKKVLPIVAIVVMTNLITAMGVMMWHYLTPNYVVVPEVTSQQQADIFDFNPNYAIQFDSSKVDYENVKKFARVRNLLKEYYYKDVNENKMLEGAISGMTEALEDPYTVYFTKDQMKQFMEKSQGSYVGIGVVVTMGEDGILTVVEPFEDSPALEVGIAKDDKIVKVDDKDVTTIRDEDMIISMIKGKENTKVKITVYRPSEGKYLDFVVTRKKIKIVNINSEILENNIGYIRISMFDSEISKDFQEHLDNMLKKNIKGLIIDLRDNPGGDYDQVTEIADRLLPEGLIVYTEDKKGNRQEKKSDSNELDIPIAVLVNENSASASEVLSGALKDHNKATLIGTKTFGKGLVQAVVNLDDGSGLKVTIARYFTPSGVCIQDVGIEPHIKVELPEKYRNVAVSQIPKEEDNQLQKAIEVIKDAIR
ncbi:S41 family peptidase [Acetivibrio clariflavus]|uniref:C-terminal processing peptidase n=1 Tax=Acetivibrio clariflavus (strain DSM 19732 / NBRC 101661 / EBR45) TaxID=720554 RepID=G8LT17_ACECE|nr:S41 family peptidase [Acetivibrio clariflavus]AEV67221.1 C-terminal processing peptidase [Acetivibrio clariflavus DSM 19732]